MCLYYIILGAMIFDHTAGKGIFLKWIPQPNPRKVEMARTSSLQDVLKKAKDIYFYDHCDYSSLCLADTNGIMIEVETSGWILETIMRTMISNPVDIKCM